MALPHTFGIIHMTELLIFAPESDIWGQARKMDGTLLILKSL